MNVNLSKTQMMKFVDANNNGKVDMHEMPMMMMYSVFSQMAGPNGTSMMDFFSQANGADPKKKTTPDIQLFPNIISANTGSGTFQTQNGEVKGVSHTEVGKLRMDGQRQSYNLAAKHDGKTQHLGRREYEQDMENSWAHTIKVGDKTALEAFGREGLNELIEDGVITPDGLGKAAKPGKDSPLEAKIKEAQADLDAMLKDVKPGSSEETTIKAKPEYAQLESRISQLGKLKSSDVATDVKAALKADKVQGFSIEGASSNKEAIIDSKAMKVGKDGRMHLDVSKLTPEQLDAIQKGTLNYGGDADLVIDNLDEDQKLNINITGGANRVVIDGDGAVDITTKNESLAVEQKEAGWLGKQKNGVFSVKGDNLRQLSIKGGSVGELDVAKLEALKLEQTRLTQELKMDKISGSGLSVDMVGVTGGQNVSLGEDGKNVVFNAKQSELGDVALKGKEVAAKMLGGYAGDVTLDSKGDANFQANNGFSAESATVKSAEDAMVVFNNASVGKADLSGVEGQTQSYIGATANVGDMKVNNSENAEVVFENQDTKDQYMQTSTIKDGKDAALSDDATKLMTADNQQEIYTKFFGMTDEQYQDYQAGISDPDMAPRKKTWVGRVFQGFGRFMKDNWNTGNAFGGAAMGAGYPVGGMGMNPNDPYNPQRRQMQYPPQGFNWNG